VRRSRLGCVSISRQDHGLHRIFELDDRIVGITAHESKPIVLAGLEVRSSKRSVRLPRGSIRGEVLSAVADPEDLALGDVHRPIGPDQLPRGICDAPRPRACP
jgi:hypothetical protein